MIMQGYSRPGPKGRLRRGGPSVWAGKITAKKCRRRAAAGGGGDLAPASLKELTWRRFNHLTPSRALRRSREHHAESEMDAMIDGCRIWRAARPPHLDKEQKGSPRLTRPYTIQGERTATEPRGFRDAVMSALFSCS
jgi:hypothetical protein